MSLVQFCAGDGTRGVAAIGGDGSQLVGPGEPLRSPASALDAGEEPEIAVAPADATVKVR